MLALPLIAALSLDATPFEMGVLVAVRQLPFLLCSLPAGVLVDRVPRRPVLIAADITSALLLFTLPAAIPLGGPAFLQLCVVAFGIGTCSIVSDVAHYAYVPKLVGREHLTESNSRLQISHSASAAGGPGLAGILIQLLTAPVAVILDAVSFLVSAVLLRSIRTPERFEEQQESRSLAEGLRMLFGHPLLRPIVVTGAIAVLFESGLLAIYVSYATRDLGLNAATIGLIFAAGGVGAIPGALLARWAGRRFGVGRAIIGGWVLAAVAGLLVPLATGPAVLVILMLAIAKALGGLTDTVADIHQWSLRQVVTPDSLAGRVTASHRFIVYGAGVAGGLLGGVLGGALGLREVLFICAVGSLLAPLRAVFSPLRELRDHPVPRHPLSPSQALVRRLRVQEEGRKEGGEGGGASACSSPEGAGSRQGCAAGGGEQGGTWAAA